MVVKLPASDFVKTPSGQDRTPRIRPVETKNSLMYLKDGFVKYPFGKIIDNRLPFFSKFIQRSINKIPSS